MSPPTGSPSPGAPVASLTLPAGSGQPPCVHNELLSCKHVASTCFTEGINILSNPVRALKSAKQLNPVTGVKRANFGKFQASPAAVRALVL
jgi:hypothetical protein